MLLDGPQTVQQLLTRVGVEATNLSQQLTVLRQTGIVVSFRDRGLVAYRLRTPAVAVLLAAGQQMLHEILSDRDGLLTELETDQGGAQPGN
ncbi:ArsR family transcriptional regulator [Actinoplanes sp. NPDC026670]|uniref:ArsR/SmtB family transcription factor n=1 Tax=Actinoplanes sp. NPDC026670 TaxID=3154700 RepID=UPI0033DB8187